MSIAMWPEFIVAPKPSVVMRVLEQASAELEKKTGGRLVLRIRQDLAGVGPLPFRFICDLWIPKLQYKYYLCEINATPEGFPATVVSADVERSDIQDEQGLEAALAEVFHSDQIKSVVQNLLSMSF